MSTMDITLYDRFSYQSLYGSHQQSAAQTGQNPIYLTPENKSHSDLHFHITTIDYGDNIIENGDTVKISQEALEAVKKLAASQNNTGMAVTATSLPTSYGYFNEDKGGFSTSPPVNFHHMSSGELSSQEDFVQKGIINQDYVNQFNSILKDGNGNLKSEDKILQAALNKYAELKNSISNSNWPDAENQLKQLENSLNWSIGTSLNQFANDMTQSNTLLVKDSTYTVDNKTYGIYKMMYGDGSLADQDIFSVDNSSYKTATNIVFSAAKLIEKGIDYINNNQYDPKNSDDASKLISAMNSGTNDADSANLSLSTLTNVISTFRGFVHASNRFVMDNADKLAQNAPAEDIAAVYTNIKNRLNLIPLGAHYGEAIP